MQKPRHIVEGTHEYGTWRTFVAYQELLESKNFKPKDRTNTDEDPLHPEHLLWMCIEMSKRIAAGNSAYPVDKANRWLGFVQAGLISNKLTTVAEERDRTRTWK